MRRGLILSVVLFVMGVSIFAEEGANVEKLYENYKTLKKAAVEMKKENEKQKGDIEAIKNALIEEYNAELKVANDSLEDTNKIAPKDFSASTPLEVYAAIKGLKEKKAIKESTKEAVIEKQQTTTEQAVQPIVK